MKSKLLADYYKNINQNSIVVAIALCATISLGGCSRTCYPTQLQFAAELEKKNCQDLGWTYWEKEKKNLRGVACTTRDGDTFRQFESTRNGLCELKHLESTI